MSAPLPGADNPRLCSASTKEEVLARVRKYLEMEWAGLVEPETKEQRQERNLAARDAAQDEFHQKRMDKLNSLPALTKEQIENGCTEFVDDRIKDYRGKFGAIRND
jgi:hypothetical protein